MVVTGTAVGSVAVTSNDTAVMQIDSGSAHFLRSTFISRLHPDVYLKRFSVLNGKFGGAAGMDLLLSECRTEGVSLQVRSNVLSNVPSHVLSNVPSRVPSNVPSSVPSDVPSDVPLSALSNDSFSISPSVSSNV